MTDQFTTGDVVRAAGHSGRWSLRYVRQGQALIERLDGSRHLAVPVSTLTRLHRAQQHDEPAATPGWGADEPTLFDPH